MSMILVFSACDNNENGLLNSDFAEYDIIIEIVDKSTGDSIKNATLELEDFNGNTQTANETTEIGVYEFENVKLEVNKEFEVSIKKDGYIDEIITLITDSDIVTKIDNEAIELKEGESGDSDTFAGGSGTENDPYLIETAEHLDNIRYNLNSYYKQIENIDLKEYIEKNYEEKGWEPIGEDFDKRFAKTYDGNDYKIINLKIYRSDARYVGLFGALSVGANIKDLTLEEVDIIGGQSIGGIAGSIYREVNINNCHVKGQTKGEDRVGGLVGHNGGEISNCSTNVEVEGERFVGGLVGWNNTGYSIENSYATGDVTGGTIKEDIGECVGGLIGENSGHVIGSFATGNVFGENSDYVGGLIGSSESNEGEIRSCYSSGNVWGKENVGGLVGETSNENKIKFSYSTGEVVGDNLVGGFVGMAIETVTITNSYSTGNVSGKEYIGGFVGEIGMGGNSDGEIRDCYSVGEVSGGYIIGGFAGGNSDIVSNCYYDTNTSGQDDEHTGIPKRTVEMSKKPTFEDWDFNDIWSIDEGSSYPYFQ